MAELDKDYFRAANKKQFPNGVWEVEGETPADSILHGDIEPRTFVSRGQSVTRQDWARQNGYFEPGSGTSLHDYEGALRGPSWSYFKLPKDTVIPDTLVVVQRGSDPHHYQIEVRVGGEIDTNTLKGALDNFARNCVVRLKQLADANT